MANGALHAGGQVAMGGARGLAASRTTSAVVASAPDALEIYFRALERSRLLTADQEIESATRIVELRRGYWSKLLGYWPFTGALLDRVERWAHEHKLDVAALAAARAAWTSWKKRPSKQRETQLAAALEVLTTAVADADLSCDLADSLVADLDALVHGSSGGDGSHGGVGLGIRTPRRDSKPFAAYVQATRRARLALDAARRDFAHANLRLVVTMAHRYRHNGRMSLADLIQEGNLGLMIAIDRFDPRRGFRFSTYGSWWIRHAISRALSDRGRVVRVPVHMIELQAKLVKARRTFEQVHGRVPDSDELVALTGIAKIKLERIGRVLLEQDEPLASSSEGGAANAQGMDVFAHPRPGVDATIDHEHAQSRLHEALETLRPMEADILRMRFGFERPAMTLREIGELYDLSRERIRQVQERALLKLRKALQTDGIDELPDGLEVLA